MVPAVAYPRWANDECVEVERADVVTMGEVHTGLLRNSVAVSPNSTVELLRRISHGEVRLFERPIAYALSPELLTGVDCVLATSNGVKARGVGTVASRATITGGHVAQGSAYVRVVPATADRRLPWSHYLARPATVEAIGKATTGQLADGFLGQRTIPGALDLTAISARALAVVQDSARLDQAAPVRTRPTRLHWVSTRDDAGSTVLFRLEPNQVRVVRIPEPAIDPAAIAGLCEDLALHDWLLTTVLALVDRAQIGSGEHALVVARLRPALDHLLHLWMPTAHTDASLADLWEALERRPGLSRQWHTTVARIRDQLALAAAAANPIDTHERRAR